MDNLQPAKEEVHGARLIPSLASCLQNLRRGVILLSRDARVSSLIVLAKRLTAALRASLAPLTGQNARLKMQDLRPG